MGKTVFTFFTNLMISATGYVKYGLQAINMTSVFVC